MLHFSKFSLETNFSENTHYLTLTTEPFFYILYKIILFLGENISSNWYITSLYHLILLCCTSNVVHIWTVRLFSCKTPYRVFYYFYSPLIFISSMKPDKKCRVTFFPNLNKMSLLRSVFLLLFFLITFYFCVSRTLNVLSAAHNSDFHMPYWNYIWHIIKYDICVKLESNDS